MPLLVNVIWIEPLTEKDAITLIADNYTSHNAIIFLPYGRAFSTSPSKLNSLHHHVHKVT